MSGDRESSTVSMDFAYSPETRKWANLHLRVSGIILVPVVVLCTSAPSMTWFVPSEGDSFPDFGALLGATVFVLVLFNLVLTPILSRLGGELYRLEGDRLCHIFLGNVWCPVITLSLVSRVVAGRGSSDGECRLLIEDKHGNVLVVHPLENMHEFIAQLERRVPVPIERTDQKLSPWTRRDRLRFLFVFVGLPSILFGARFIPGV